LSEIINREASASYEELDVNTRRADSYQGLGGPSEVGQGHDYFEIRPDSYQEPATTPVDDYLTPVEYQSV